MNDDWERSAFDDTTDQMPTEETKLTEEAQKPELKRRLSDVVEGSSNLP